LGGFFFGRLKSNETLAGSTCKWSKFSLVWLKPSL